MDNPDSDLKKMIETEEEISLIEYLLIQLRCEEGEPNVVKKKDIHDMVEERGIQFEEKEFNDLLEILFSEQKEETQWEVYQRLVALVSNEGNEEEGEGEQEGENEGKEEEYRNEEGEEGEEYQEQEEEHIQEGERERIGEEDQYQREEEENEPEHEQEHGVRQMEEDYGKAAKNYTQEPLQIERKEIKEEHIQEKQVKEIIISKEENKESTKPQKENKYYYIDEDHSKKDKAQNEIQHKAPSDNDKGNNNPKVIYKRELEPKKDTNGIGNLFKQTHEERNQHQKPSLNALSDLDLLSDNYSHKKKEPTKISSYKADIHQLDRMNKVNDPIYTSKDFAFIPLKKSPYQKRASPMKFDSVIQPINIFNNFPSLNKQSLPYSKESLKPNPNPLRSSYKARRSNDLFHPGNQRKLYQQPPSYSTTTKYSALNPRDAMKANRTFTNAKEQDYFYSMFEHITSDKKNMKGLTDKITNVTSKAHRREVKDAFLVNKYEPAVQSYPNDYKAFTRDYQAKMNPKQREPFDYEPYVPGRSYVNQNVNLNYNYNFNSFNDARNQMPYAFKSKNYNLKDPKEKEMYIETLKKDLKEFTYQKEQIKKTRDDAFEKIDNQLEQLMKKPHPREENIQKEEIISDDQVNQGYPNDQEGENNNEQN